MEIAKMELWKKVSGTWTLLGTVTDSTPGRLMGAGEMAIAGTNAGGGTIDDLRYGADNGLSAFTDPPLIDDFSVAQAPLASGLWGPAISYYDPAISFFGGKCVATGGVCNFANSHCSSVWHDSKRDAAMQFTITDVSGGSPPYFRMILRVENPATPNAKGYSVRFNRATTDAGVARVGSADSAAGGLGLGNIVLPIEPAVGQIYGWRVYNTGVADLPQIASIF